MSCLFSWEVLHGQKEGQGRNVFSLIMVLLISTVSMRMLISVVSLLCFSFDAFRRYEQDASFLSGGGMFVLGNQRPQCKPKRVQEGAPC